MSARTRGETLETVTNMEMELTTIRARLDAAKAYCRERMEHTDGAAVFCSGQRKVARAVLRILNGIERIPLDVVRGPRRQVTNNQGA